MEILFTVVIPAYNIASYIRPCIDSVLASMKDCRDTQILIVDDGSTDGTALAADECCTKDCRIKVIHQSNQGAAAARNTAIKNAQGKYCIFVDGDDEMLPNAIDSIRECVETAPDAVVSRFKTIDGEGNIEERMQYNFELLSALPPHRLYDKIGCPTAPWVFCVKTQFMIDNGLLFEHGIFPYEDDEWGARMFFAAKSVVLNSEYCYLYRVGRTGSGTTAPNSLLPLREAKVPDLYWKKFHDGAQKGIYSGKVLAEALRYTRRFYTDLAMRSRTFSKNENYKELLSTIASSAYILENSPSRKERVLFSLMHILGTKRGIDAFCTLVSLRKSSAVKAARWAVTFPFRAVRKVYRLTRDALFPDMVCGTVFMLHRVGEWDSGALFPNENMKITPATLERVIDKMRQTHNFIPSTEVHDYIERKAYKKKPFCVFALDDGYKDNYTEAYPVFKRNGVPFTIFLAASFPEQDAILWWYVLEDLLQAHSKITLADGSVYRAETKAQKEEAFLAIRLKILDLDQRDLLAGLNKMFAAYDVDWRGKCAELCMTWDEAAALNGEPLCTIGAHTRHHYNLKALPTEGDVVQEIMEGVDMLHSHGIKASVFAYPFGSHNEVGEREEKVLKGMQFTNAFLACGGETKRRGYKRYAVPRLMLTEEYAKGLLEK